MRPKWCGMGRGTPNPIVCGRRFCGSCGRWRHVCDFHFTRVHGFPRLDAYCRACRRVRKRRDHANLSPEQRQLVRERGRFNAERKRRQEGVPQRQFKNRQTVIDRAERVFLATGPILEEIDRWLMLHLPEWRRDEDRSVENLARLAGMSARGIYRLQTGESEHVRLDVADKLARALDIPLALIYPEDQEMAA